MSISWLVPGALIGVALVAWPIAIHLLVRQQTRTLPFPSLRFLQETQLAAFRRQSIQDAWLLGCRAAIITVAAAALAGPLLHSPARQAAYAARTSRAVVTTPDGADRETLARVADGAFASATFTRAKIADALADAARWLDAQPASAREIVIAGALRRGDLTDADIGGVNDAIGLRFVAAADPGPQLPGTLPVLTRRDGRLVRIDRPLRAEPDRTHIAEAAAIAVPQDLVTTAAAAGDAVLAEAALAAALNAGVPWMDFTQRVVIVWEGAAPMPDTPTVRIATMPVPSPPARAADAVREVLATLSPPPLREPVLISADQLAAWTRMPGPPSQDARLVDEGDRRWLWGGVLALLALEARLRRSRASATQPAAEEGARVA
jgi:hypothetical protein